MLEATCQGYGGSYQGDGVACTDSVCITSDVDAAVAPVDSKPRAYPNPSSGPTTITFSLAQPGWSSVRIFDAGGRLVRVLGVGEMSVGQHAMLWDGRNDEGEVVATGIYFTRVATGSNGMNGQVVLTR